MYDITKMKKKILVTFKKNDVLEISEKIRQMVSIDMRLKRVDYIKAIFR